MSTPKTTLQAAMLALLEFHFTYGAHVEELPTVDVPVEVKMLRLELIREEFEELAQALTGQGDLKVGYSIPIDWDAEKDMQPKTWMSSERLGELKDYLSWDNSGLVETADALADLLYVIYGACVSFGIPIEPIFAEVHASNMSKLGEDGKPIYRESDGKVLKGPNCFKPDIAGVPERQKKIRRAAFARFDAEQN